MVDRSNIRRTGLMALMALAGLAAASSNAQAWWGGGVYIGGPVVVGPPIAPYPYAYPPSYYPPAYYPPPYRYAPQAASPAQSQSSQLAQSNAPYGSRCYAGVYTCIAPSGGRVGQECSCAGIGAPSYGVVQ